ncbi:methyltransferase domain-containing protein [Serinicoccus hydrothermalis]|uniref:methyltransferase domain-containing protein n=1 Tax=Serinicoccus hydrothermalis TaxID=1758689 RepID=UPI001F185D97|nr:methyltransferase domain-containing protein [Serinicoccus hydrothermalis]
MHRRDELSPPTGPDTTSPSARTTEAEQLDEAFDKAAPRYDLLTRLNPGYHRALRRAASQLVSRLEVPAHTPTDGAGSPLTLWDLGCGSGLSTRALLRATGPQVRLVGLDASAGMLDQARAKDWPGGVDFVHATAQDLPEVAATQLGRPADGAFAAYLLRNVPQEQRDGVLRAIHDQVRPGGWITLQDYHVAGDARAERTWTAVCRGVVTPLATVTRGHPAIYRYLWRSVLDNDSTDVLEDRVRRAGFVDVSWSSAGGWQRGILHTLLARRPSREVTA